MDTLSICSNIYLLTEQDYLKVYGLWVGFERARRDQIFEFFSADHMTIKFRTCPWCTHSNLYQEPRDHALLQYPLLEKLWEMETEISLTSNLSASNVDGGLWIPRQTRRMFSHRVK